jgi:hypothetical protein
MQGTVAASDWDELSNAIGLRRIMTWGELWVVSNRDVTFNVEVDIGGNMMKSRMSHFWIGDRDLLGGVCRSVDGLCG